MYGIKMKFERPKPGKITNFCGKCMLRRRHKLRRNTVQFGRIHSQAISKRCGRFASPIPHKDTSNKKEHETGKTKTQPFYVGGVARPDRICVYQTAARTAYQSVAQGGKSVKNAEVKNPRNIYAYVTGQVCFAAHYYSGDKEYALKMLISMADDDWDTNPTEIREMVDKLNCTSEHQKCFYTLAGVFYKVTFRVSIAELMISNAIDVRTGKFNRKIVQYANILPANPWLVHFGYTDGRRYVFI